MLFSMSPVNYSNILTVDGASTVTHSKNLIAESKGVEPSGFEPPARISGPVDHHRSLLSNNEKGKTF
jgi:hypothetical protein